jgi:hypothetical protein
MFDMLIEIAFSNPNLRGSRACGPPAYAGLVPGFAVTREPFLRKRARILQMALDDQQILTLFKALRRAFEWLSCALYRSKMLTAKQASGEPAGGIFD